MRMRPRSIRKSAASSMLASTLNKSGVNTLWMLVLGHEFVFFEDRKKGLGPNHGWNTDTSRR